MAVDEVTFPLKKANHAQVAMRPYPSINPTAHKQGSQVPSSLGSPAAGYLQRWANE